MTRICSKNFLSQPTVREIGFNTELYLDACRETIFFLGPQLVDGRKRYAVAPPESIHEFISYWENQLAVSRDYLANDCNPRTHQWTRSISPLRRAVAWARYWRACAEYGEAEMDYERGGIMEITAAEEAKPRLKAHARRINKRFGLDPKGVL